MKHFFCTLIVASLVGALSAQDTLRIGYIDFEHVLSQMDEYASVQKEIDHLAKTYTDEYKRMESEYNDKVKDYITNGKTLSEPIKLAHQAEITEYEERMALYKKRYIAEIENQREAQEKPVRDKLKNAIKQVADAQKITLVLDGKTPIYATSPCVDLTEDVQLLLK